MDMETRKPTATVYSDGRALVVLPTGEAAWIEPDTSGLYGRGFYRWRIDGDDDAPSGVACGREHAYRGALHASARRTMRPARVVGWTADRCITAERESDYARTLKRVLRQSTGHGGFRVRHSRGTAAAWIHVSGTDPLGELWVAAIYGTADHSIPPTRGYRASALAAAAGVPDDITLGEHAWD